MKKRSARLDLRVAAVVLGACAATCSPGGGPQTGSQTNWLTECQSDAACGDLQCLCGVCTRDCSGEASCSDLPGASCVSAEDAGAIAVCAGNRPTTAGLCLPSCSTGDCGNGMSCVAGVCRPTPEPTTRVSVDDTLRFQTLVGIGAGIGYQFDEIAQHPRKAALFDAMFSESGITVLRLRNRYGQDREEDLGSTSEIVAAATERLGQSLTIILNSASPPGSLKQNGSNWCDGDPDTCTLVKLGDGTFDYTGLANHWRASLDAYADAGVVPGYISIQNNPNWVPSMGDPNEACRFLPTQGTTMVTTGTGEIEVEYPGYAEALEAVLDQFTGLGSVPKVVAPETSGIADVADYIAELDPTRVDAFAHHLYGTDTTNLDLAALAALRDLGQEHERPLFQSEMYADPLTTAVLMHASLAVEGAAVYIHNGFVASASEIQPDGLINLTADDFAIGDTYHVMRHYSRHIRPGWVRLAAESDTEGLLASAWASPETSVIVVVLTNPGPTEKVVQIASGQDDSTATEVTRTVLRGHERSVALGALSREGIVTLPGQSIVTVTIQK